MITLLFLSFITVSTLDIQRHIEYQNTLNYLIELSKTGQLANFNLDHFKQCVSLQCCICQEEFKSSKASAIHYALYHRNQLQHKESIGVLFDEDVPSQQRYQFCLEYIPSVGSWEQKVVEEVCTVLAWNMHRRDSWVQLIKYVLYVLVGFISLIFYSDIAKPWK